ncbi:MAG: MafI family immunity protein [Candidatus Omnitrophica bacterium]|nr:MafI family immunity protein [Candidatus Omnitrophota bacterium]
MHTNEYYAALEKELKEILLVVGGSLPADDQEEITGFIAHGEYGLAFETLCLSFKLKCSKMPLEVRASVERLGRKMKLEPSLWEEIISENNSGTCI